MSLEGVRPASIAEGKLDKYSHVCALLEPQRMQQAVDLVIANGREQRFARTRIIGHMEWALEGHRGSELRELRQRVPAHAS